MRFGTYEDALAVADGWVQVLESDVPVSEALAKGFAGMIQDANPAYWEGVEEFGGPIVPPAMMLSWLLPMPWRPGGEPSPLPAAATLPLPGDSVINHYQEVELFRVLRYGTRLRLTEQIAEVSTEKRTALGTGHFITTSMTIVDAETDELVALITNRVYRYLPHRAADGAGS
jgi:hypothetical protein